jgi:hypothetical protein
VQAVAIIDSAGSFEEAERIRASYPSSQSGVTSGWLARAHKMMKKKESMYYVN